MSDTDTIEINIPIIPGISQVVLREAALVSLNSASAGVGTETVYRLAWPILLLPPQVSSSCDDVRTWTFSGRHVTTVDGTTEIRLNKFLECLPGMIKDVVPDHNDSPVVAGVFYENYIGSVPYFTATPESQEPVFLTFTSDVQAVQPPQGQVFFTQAWDIRIRVRSWKHDGTPAPNIAFSWIAIARTARVTNI